MGGVQNWFEDLWDWISTAAVDAVSIVSDWIWDSIDWLKARVDESFTAITGLIGDTWDKIDTALEAGWATITTAVDNENYKLDTKILHSDAGVAGKMNYRDVTFVAPRVVGANVDFDVIRSFINETDATITVKEIGIVCADGEYSKFFLVLRDVVTPETVEAGYTLTVTYTLRTTV